MPSKLVIGSNTYRSRSQATTYLDDSTRATAWVGLDPDSQDRALLTAFRLIERIAYDGSITPVNVVATATVAAGGTGYSVGDVLSVSTGTGTAATAEVLTLSGSAVATIQLLDVGLYTVDPDATSATTVSPSGGTGCTLALTFQEQTAQFPRKGLTRKNSITVDDSTYPTELGDAQIELAYELSQDTSLETSGGTGSNIKRVKADTAEVEFFIPTVDTSGTGGTPFPKIVFDLLCNFISGDGATFGPANNTGVSDDISSQFGSDAGFTLNEGLA